MTMQWESSEDDAAAMNLGRSLGREIDNVAARHGSDLAYRFMNDAHQRQDVFSSYGCRNKEILLEISRKYDPEGIFQTLQNGGWLLSRDRSVRCINRSFS